MTTKIVWLASYEVDYEGETLVDVCSTRERALVALALRCVDEDGDYVIGDRHWVTRCEVDGKWAADEVFPRELREVARMERVSGASRARRGTR